MQQIQGKFLSLLVGGFFITLVIAFWGGKFLFRIVETELGSGFSKKQVLYDRERSIRPILTELFLTKKLAKSLEISQWAANETSQTSKKLALAKLENFRLDSADQSYFIALSGNKGLYFNDDKTPFSDKPRYFLEQKKQEDHWFFNTLKQDKTCLLNVDYNEVMKITKVWINCVIILDGIPQGVVGTGFDLSKFINQVINDSDAGISNLFIDSKGAIQAHKDHEMIDFNTISKEGEPVKSFFSLISGESEQAEFRNALFQLKKHPGAVNLELEVQGNDYLIGIAYIPEIDWYNVSMLKVGNFGRGDTFMWIVGFIVLALLLILSLFFIIVKWMVFDRLEKLDQTVALMGDGDYSSINEQAKSDEIGNLAANVTEMARSIEARTSELERVVKERTDELSLVNNAKDKFFSIISHDLRGPTGSLAIILNEVIKQPSDLDEALLGGMQRTTTNLYNLLNQLLEWAKSQQGKLEMNLIDFEVSHPIEEMIGLLIGQAEQKGVVITSKVSPELYVHADVATVTTIIRNLLGNAVKFTAKGGQVSIEAKAKGDSIQIRVVDNGIGIPKQELGKLFKIGEKAKTSLGTEQEEGSGLGLILCAEFVAKNGGKIGVDSTEGKGSSFWVTLPRGEKPTKPQEKVRLDFDLYRVLLVEDNPVHQKSSSNGLNTIGLPHEIASNGLEALEWLEKESFDLVLMDIDMPKMNGIEATAKIREIYGNKPMIFALSAYSQLEMVEAHPMSDFPIYLNKPLSPDELALALFQMLKQDL
ncbi:MAG: ATP-binding protein [SAR324 cluster bacterium]|nr:ATP-binding protein [SAR324 cluster bacterium]